MQKKISSIPFSGTPEQEAKLKEVIARNIDDPGAVMPVLQEAQEIYGYLPIEVQKMVAEGLNVPLEEVYGVSTFYSQFALSPKARAISSTSFPKSSVLRRRNVHPTASSRLQRAVVSARADSLR